MTLRGLLRGSLLYTLGNFLPRIGAFLLLPVYTATMSPAQFGVVSLMLSLSGLLALVYRLGLDGAVLRLHFDVDEQRRPALYMTMSAATFVVSLALSVGCGLIGMAVFTHLFAGVPFWPIGAITLALTGVMAFQYIPASLYRGTERPGRFVVFTLGTFAVAAAATLVFLLGLDLGAAGALLGQLAGGVVVVGFVAALVIRLWPARVDVGLLRAALAFGLPLMPHSLAAWVLHLSDRWLIGLLIGGSAAATQAAIGVYSFGYILGQVVSLVALSFNAAWIPFFYARGEGPQGPAILREMTTLAMGGLAVLAVGIGSLAPELVLLLAAERWGPASAAAADVTPLVAVASLAYGMYFLVVSAIFLTRRTWSLPLLTGSAGLANVAANLLLLPLLGIVGAAWGALIGYATLALLTWLIARRVYPVQLDVARLVALVGGAVLAIGASRILAPGGESLLPAGLVHLAVAAAYALAAAVVLRGTAARLRTLVAAGNRPATPR